MAITKTKHTNNKNSINVTVKMDTGTVVEKLQQFGPKLVRRSLRSALRAVGDFWIPAVQAKVPTDSGDLRNSIDKKITTRMVNNKEAGMKTPVGTVTVGPTLVARSDHKEHSVGPGVYGMWVEFGLKLKKYAFTPFMRPTFDSTVEKAQRIFADKLKEGFDSMGKD
jgi:HK97 gp10 family phage protein